MKAFSLFAATCFALTGCSQQAPSAPPSVTIEQVQPLFDFTKASKAADESQTAVLTEIKSVEDDQTATLVKIEENTSAQTQCLKDALDAQAKADAEQAAQNAETLRRLDETLAELSNALTAKEPPAPESPGELPPPSDGEASSVRPVTIDGEVLELESFIAKWHNSEGRYKAPVPKNADETPTGAMVAHLVDLGVTEADLDGIDYDTLDKLHNAIHERQKAEKHVAPAAPRKAPSAPKATFDGVDVRTFVKQWYNGERYWSHPNPLKSHLQGPNHNVDPDVLSGMSRDEQEKLHTALHRQAVAAPSRSRSVVRSYSSTVPAVPRASSNCPGGVCPVAPRSTNEGWLGSLRIERQQNRAERKARK